MVGDVYRYTYWRIRVYLPVHLAAIASKDSYSNSCGVDCTDRRVCTSLAINIIVTLLGPAAGQDGIQTRGRKLQLRVGLGRQHSC